MRPRAVVLVAVVAAVLQLATPTAALVVPAPAVEALTHPKATTFSPTSGWTSVAPR